MLDLHKRSHARRAEFSGVVCGYWAKDNRVADIGAPLSEGHDFALIAARWLVDYWAFRVARVSPRAVLDLRLPHDKKLAQRLYGGQESWGRHHTMSRNPNWAREEHILAFNLYCQIPFSTIHMRNPKLRQLAKLIGRTVGSVSWKLANFARLDPALHARGIRGAERGAGVGGVFPRPRSSGLREPKTHGRAAAHAARGLR